MSSFMYVGFWDSLMEYTAISFKLFELRQKSEKIGGRFNTASTSENWQDVTRALWMVLGEIEELSNELADWLYESLRPQGVKGKISTQGLKSFFYTVLVANCFQYQVTWLAAKYGKMQKVLRKWLGWFAIFHKYTAKQFHGIQRVVDFAERIFLQD